MFILHVPLDSNARELAKLIILFRDAGYRFADASLTDTTATLYFERKRS